MEAQEIIIDVIRNSAAFINAMRNKAPAEKVTMFRRELNGMLVCLNRLSPESKFYTIKDLEAGYEFGYYEDNGKWFSIEK